MAHADERMRLRGAAYIVARVRSTWHATRPFMDLQSVSVIALEQRSKHSGRKFESSQTVIVDGKSLMALLGSTTNLQNFAVS